MDLRNYTITVGEVLQNPRARALLTREFPMAMRSPMLARAQNMPLSNLITMARRYLPPQKLNQIINQLQAV